ncbi:MAG: peptidoglycan recognition family protein [candidate division WOR-3 bacterium]
MKPEYIIIHHSATSRDLTKLEAIDNYHKLKGFPKSSLGYYAGYHLVITGDGTSYQTRAFDEEGCHASALGMNKKSVGICLTGNFEQENPSSEQLKTLEKEIEKIKEIYQIPVEKVIGHCEIPYQTACPGKNLLSWLIEWRNSKIRVGDNEKIKKIRELAEEILKLCK